MHAINEETADDVRAWQANAQSVQDDIVRSKTLANQILREAETPDVSGKAEREAEAKAQFLVRELSYNQQVQNALRGIKGVNATLDQVERARDERRILDALHLLESENPAKCPATRHPLTAVPRIVERAKCYTSEQVLPCYKAS